MPIPVGEDGHEYLVLLQQFGRISQLRECRNMSAEVRREDAGDDAGRDKQLFGSWLGASPHASCWFAVPIILRLNGLEDEIGLDIELGET